MILLKADKVTKRFGGLTAVSELDFELEEGAIASVIGPNGAGKTTFFNCLTGYFQADEGSITFSGFPIHRLRPDQIAHQGISRTYQNIRLFASMTAIENILVGQHNHMRSTWLGAIFRTPFQRKEEEAGVAEARRLLEFVGLKGRGDSLAVKLPYGDQRRLEVARALGNKPRLLLLDEPTAGMNPAESAQMTDLFRKLRGELGHHGPADRARDARRDGDLGEDHRARLRRKDRRGHAGGDPARSACHRGLSRTRRRRRACRQRRRCSR